MEPFITKWKWPAILCAGVMQDIQMENVFVSLDIMFSEVVVVKHVPKAQFIKIINVWLNATKMKYLEDKHVFVMRDM